MEALKEGIERFLNISSVYGCGSGTGIGNSDGNGYGSGYGSSCGYDYSTGYGCGDGSGYGSGCGDGYGKGNGSGGGNDYGNGSDFSSGSGTGTGYGSVYGSNFGSGIKSFNGRQIYMIDELMTLINEVRGDIAKGNILQLDFTLTPCFIVKQDNMFAHGETLHKAHEALQNKLFQKYPEEVRIAKFKEQYPDFDKKIPAIELFEWHNRLTGSCEMGRRSFAQDKGIDINKDSFTVREFIKLTKNSYGGKTIQKLKKQYK